MAEEINGGEIPQAMVVQRKGTRVSIVWIIPILAAGTGYLYFTLQEINSAAHLKEAIARIGITEVPL